MKIAQCVLDNPFILAPLAGITNLPFRLMAKSFGCSLVCSEMISSHGLVYGSSKTFDYLISDPIEKPTSFQIFGSKPDIMAEAAKIVESQGADILDINMGCSVRKILKCGAGAALMGDYQKAKSILKSVRNAINIPLTIKIRSGWDATGTDAMHISRIAVDCGVDAITIHPRTVKQAFSGLADWSLIRKLKAAINLPVIGNGDIDTPEKALKMIEETGCDGVMIGRAAIHSPWIFKSMLAHYYKISNTELSLFDQFKTICEYVDGSIKCFGEQKACLLMRSRLGWFTKGLPNSSRLRESIKHVNNRMQIYQILWEFYNDTINLQLKLNETVSQRIA